MKEITEMSLQEKLIYGRELMLDKLIGELEDDNTENVGVLNQLLNANNINEGKRTEEGQHSKIKRLVKK